MRHRRRSPRRAHPRRRGEHFEAANAARGTAGSSPQARGAPFPCTRASGARGLIPAGAGSTQVRPARCPTRVAHPRRRGEHPALTVSVCSLPGSSPQARGARPPWWGWWPCPRLIPAGAGSTTILRARKAAAPGSSPQARGAPVQLGEPRVVTRLIPAGAGSTTWSWGLPTRNSAHPRRRGEHHPGRRHHRLPGGLIPAGAGSTLGD